MIVGVVSGRLCAVFTGARKGCLRERARETTHARRAAAPRHSFHRHFRSLLKDGKADDFAEAEGLKFCAHENDSVSLASGVNFRAPWAGCLGST